MATEVSKFTVDYMVTSAAGVTLVGPCRAVTLLRHAIHSVNVLEGPRGEAVAHVRFMDHTPLLVVHFAHAVTAVYFAIAVHSHDPDPTHYKDASKFFMP